MGDQKTSPRDVGGSLPVANVQQLASHNCKHIPNRYIRPDLDYTNISIDESLEIPIIDMTKLCGEQSKEYDEELAKLHQACKYWGFFQLINHGATEVIEEMKVVTEEFFKLPLEEKKRCGQVANNIEGYGQAFVVSEDQKLDWGDMLFLMSLPLSLRNMMFWPITPLNFRPTLHNYSKEVHNIALKLLRWMGINLGIEPHKLTSVFEDCNQGIRMNYYPPCMEADKVIGLAPHSDATALTLLVQINQVQGLQIKKDCKWIPVEPVSDAIIVNIGDVLEIMSNGEYRSIEHRAVVSFEKERLSMATFHSPDLRTEIGPLPDLVKQCGEKYKRISHQEYVRLVVATKLDGKSLLDHLKISILKDI